jgi:membrane protease YdiL (CAAX protease family)
LTAAQHILAFLVVAAYPLWDLFDTRDLKSGANPAARLTYYKKTLVLEWLGAIVAFAVMGPRMFRIATPMPHVGQMHPPIARAMAWALAAAIAFLALSPHVRALSNEKVLRILLRQYARLSFFTPKSAPEFRWFAALSVTAGICEETIYRGFLIYYFGVSPWRWGILAALAISSISFATAHLYLGAHAVSTLVGGFIFALLFLLTGSLLVPMIVHAAADLMAIPVLRRASAAQAASS